MKTERDGAISGTAKEILPLLEKEIAAHREAIHRSIDLAFEFLVRIMKTANSGGVRGTDFGPIFIWLEDETGVLLSNQQKDYVATELVEHIVSLGGMTVCAVYGIAHIFEHALFPTKH